MASWMPLFHDRLIIWRGIRLNSLGWWSLSRRIECSNRLFKWIVTILWRWMIIRSYRWIVKSSMLITNRLLNRLVDMDWLLRRWRSRGRDDLLNRDKPSARIVFAGHKHGVDDSRDPETKGQANADTKLSRTAFLDGHWKWWHQDGQHTKATIAATTHPFAFESNRTMNSLFGSSLSKCCDHF